MRPVDVVSFISRNGTVTEDAHVATTLAWLLVAVRTTTRESANIRTDRISRSRQPRYDRSIRYGDQNDLGRTYSLTSRRRFLGT